VVGGVTVSGGDVLEILADGAADNTSVLLDGTEVVDPGGAADGTIEGGLEDVFGFLGSRVRILCVAVRTSAKAHISKWLAALPSGLEIYLWGR
jgi:autotransporter passenger strand-loop-strand repeat protein